MHSSCSGETKTDEDGKARIGSYILLLLLLELELTRASPYV
jgi:hypothetical protein